MMSREIYPAPLSKTAKYKKITKPLLERKRRARINRCLDELKDLMVGALEIDDDNMSKLEKADILELTVNHLTKLHSPRDPVLEAKKFQAGFGQCAAEACRFILSMPDLDARISENLVNHLSRLISTQPLTVQVPGRQAYSPPVSPPSPIHEDRDSIDFSDNERYSSDAVSDDQYSGDDCQDVKMVQPVFIPTEGSDRIEKVQHFSSTAQVMAATPSVKDLASPMTGLLTTVDKMRTPPIQMPNVHSFQNHQQVRRNTDIGNVTTRPTPDSKDIILQKIRQHIMEKRSHDSNEKQCSPSEVHIDKQYAIEVIDRQKDIKDINRSSVIIKSNVESEIVPESLDLRKVRSPSKTLAARMQNVNKSLNAPKLCSDSESSAFKSLKRDLDRQVGQYAPQIAEPKDVSIDYHNLPPKKKRKHLEYQEKKLNEVGIQHHDSDAAKFDILDLNEEQKSRLMQHYEFLARQELARDNLDMACQEYDEEGPMWRPW